MLKMIVIAILNYNNIVLSTNFDLLGLCATFIS